MAANLPLGQAAHAADPLLPLLGFARPAAQSSHATEAVGSCACLPGGHNAHVDAAVAPTVVENVPLAQLEHSDDAALAVYLPGGQLMHALAAVAAISADALPEAQLVHTADPAVSAK